MYQQKVEGAPCENGCGGKNVKNPKTGKIFCENKCWLTSPSKTGTYPKQEQPVNTTGDPNLMLNSSNSAPSEPNWDKISWGKCKHAFLVEAFKNYSNKPEADSDLKRIEQVAEQWADMSMRRLGEPQLKDFGNGEVADQVPF